MRLHLGRVAALRNLLLVAVALFFAGPVLAAGSSFKFRPHPQASQNGETWRRYEAPQLGFSVDVMGELTFRDPTRGMKGLSDEVLADLKQNGMAMAFQGAFTKPEAEPVELSYVVYVTKIPPNDTRTTAEILTAPRESLNVKQVRQSGVKGVQYSEGGGQGCVRVFVTNGRLYKLSVWSADLLPPREFEKWFASLKLIPIPEHQ